MQRDLLDLYSIIGHDFFAAIPIKPITMAATLAASTGNSGGIGGYKDISPVSFSSEAELKGTTEAPPASYPHYLPVWDKTTT